MKKHTRATPAGVPRSRSKYTRRQRRRFLAGYIARKQVWFAFSASDACIVTTLETAQELLRSVDWSVATLTPPA